MRKPIIAGNWKMNNTIAAGTALVKELAPLVKDNNAVDIVVCPTFTALAAVCEAVKGTNIHVGAQNVHWEKAVLSLAKFPLKCSQNLALNML